MPKTLAMDVEFLSESMVEGEGWKAEKYKAKPRLSSDALSSGSCNLLQADLSPVEGGVLFIGAISYLCLGPEVSEPTRAHAQAAIAGAEAVGRTC